MPRIDINENYSVDEIGNVYSRPRHGTKGGILKWVISPKGYPVVSIPPSRSPVKVHRLVATAFVPNPDNLPYVNHIDGNKLNCAATNLEWCTNQQNIAHAYAHGMIKPPINELKLRPIKQQVVERYVEGCKINGARAIARELGVSKNTILRLVRSL